jgi:hypothetical protein
VGGLGPGDLVIVPIPDLVVTPVALVARPVQGSERDDWVGLVERPPHPGLGGLASTRLLRAPSTAPLPIQKPSFLNRAYLIR